MDELNGLEMQVKVGIVKDEKNSDLGHYKEAQKYIQECKQTRIHDIKELSDKIIREIEQLKSTQPQNEQEMTQFNDKIQKILKERKTLQENYYFTSNYNCEAIHDFNKADM